MDEPSPEDRPTTRDEVALAPTVESADASEPEPALGLPRIRRKRVLAALFEEGPREPQTFGRFRVVERLGRGGMGTVFEADDPQLERTVAIKVLHARAGGEHQRRLMREAQALARLSHPNVVQVFETGEADGRPFVAMELVRGRTLRDWLGQPHPWPECLDVYLQAARGLAAAHGVAIVHRDFKPANCIIDDEGRVRVLDFGLARGHAEVDDDEELDSTSDGDGDAEDSGRAIDQRLTQTGTLLGTPAYMAPEQARRAPADARSDQFAFCVALYEALYGTRPFDGLPDLLELAEGQRPSFESAPSHATLPRVPAWLRQTIARGLEARPEDRFRDMDALLEAVERNLRALRRRKLVLGVGGGLVATAALGLAVTAAVLSVRESRHRAECESLGGAVEEHWNDEAKRAIAEAFGRSGAPGADATLRRIEPGLDAWTGSWRDARTSACLEAPKAPEQGRRRAACLEQERWELEALVDVLATADRTTVLEAVSAALDLPEIARCRDPAWLAADVSLHDAEPGIRTRGVELRRELSRVLALERTGRYDEALSLAETSVEAARTLGDPVVEAESLAKLGAIRWRMADFAPAEQSLLAAHFLAGRNEHDRVAYGTARDLAWVVGVRLARPSEGLVWLEHARMNLARTGGDPDRDPELLVMLADLEDAQGHPHEALAAHERALALREQRLGAEHPDVADSLINLGRLQGVLDDERALPTLRRGRAIAETTLGPAHPVVANADNELGVLLTGLGRVDEGIAAYRRAIETRERALGSDDPGLATMLSNLAAALNDQGEVKESFALLKRAVSILEHDLGPDHPDTLVASINLGAAEAEVGAVPEAIARLRRTLDGAERVLGPEDPYVAATLANLAHWLEHQGDHASALPLRRRLIELDEAILGPDHTEVADDATALARTCLRVGETEAALHSYERALSIRSRAEPVDPRTMARSHDDVALALLALGRDDEAAAQHRLALELDDAGAADLEPLRAELANLLDPRP